MDYRTINSIALAYMGDAVYEQYIRQRVIERCHSPHADVMHRAGVRYVNASAQCAALKHILPQLSEEEAGVVRRARNHKIATKAKNADAVTYKWATAFEALIGYLFFAERSERLQEIMLLAAEFTESR
ncbi:MAG: ribonuclease III [Clostridia bacterium]|nr:ribonuclease III [Clostridia bacterium]